MTTVRYILFTYLNLSRLQNGKMIMSITNLFIPRTVQTYRCSILHNSKIKKKKKSKLVECIILICKMLRHYTNFLLHAIFESLISYFESFTYLVKLNIAFIYLLFYNKYMKYCLIISYSMQQNIEYKLIVKKNIYVRN